MLNHPSHHHRSAIGAAVHAAPPMLAPLWRYAAGQLVTCFGLFATLSLCSNCHGPRTNAPQGAAISAASLDVKPVLRKTRHWDGSVSLLHEDTSTTVAVWPMQLRTGPDGSISVPVGKRCERIAHGAPYVNDNPRTSPSVLAFEDLLHAAPREFARTEVEQRDPCTAEFGAEWRVPSRAEFAAYAADLARAGAWYVRAPSGMLEMVDYAPKFQIRVAEAIEIPARIRPALVDTAHVFCLRTASTSSEPTEPSREEVERCVRLFHATTSNTTEAVEVPASTLPELIAVRQACRQNGPTAEWLRILDDVELEVQRWSAALLDPALREGPLDPTTENFIDAIFSTLHVCLEQPLHRSAQSNASALLRLREIEAILENAQETRARVLKEQQEVVIPTQSPVKIPMLNRAEPTREPRPLRCGCAVSDLACNMRCAARH